jgi:hypothetical protein
MWDATVEMAPSSAPSDAQEPTTTSAGAWSEPDSATVWMTDDATTPYAGYARVAPPPPPILAGRGAWRWKAALSATLVGLAVVLLIAAVGLAQHGSSVPQAQASGGTPAISTARPTASATPTQTATPLPVGNGAPIAGWQQNAGCTIANGTLYAANIGDVNGGAPCLSPDPPLQDGRIQVNATFLSDGDEAIGIAFRVAYQGPMLNDDEVYLSSDGTVSGYVHVDGATMTLFDPRQVSHIATGAGATNTLKVVAQGPSIVIYVNGHRVATAFDTSNLNVQGQEGVVVWQPGQRGAFRGWSVMSLDGNSPPSGG